MPESPRLIADGDIHPCRFIKKSGQFTAVQADADSVPFGISAEFTRGTPLPSAAATEFLHAKQGDHITTFLTDQVCLLESGTSGFTADQFLKPDADGKGEAAYVGDIAGAIALETVAPGVKGRVRVLQPGIESPIAAP